MRDRLGRSFWQASEGGRGERRRQPHPAPRRDDFLMSVTLSKTYLSLLMSLLILYPDFLSSLQTRCRTHAAALLAFVKSEALGSRPAPGTPSGAFNLFAPEGDSTLKKGHPGDADQREPDMGGAENVGRKGVTWGARGGEKPGRIRLGKDPGK